MGAGVVVAFVDGDLLALFPEEEGMEAVGAIEPGLCSVTGMDLRQARADFASELGTFFAVIEVEVWGGSRAVSAEGIRGDLRFGVSGMYGLKRVAVLS